MHPCTVTQHAARTFDLPDLWAHLFGCVLHRVYLAEPSFLFLGLAYRFCHVSHSCPVLPALSAVPRASQSQHEIGRVLLDLVLENQHRMDTVTVTSVESPDASWSVADLNRRVRAPTCLCLCLSPCPVLFEVVALVLPALAG